MLLLLRWLVALAAVQAAGASTPPPAPPGFAALLVGSHSPLGKVLRPANFTLTRPGATFDAYHLPLAYAQVSETKNNNNNKKRIKKKDGGKKKHDTQLTSRSANIAQTYAEYGSYGVNYTQQYNSSTCRKLDVASYACTGQLSAAATVPVRPNRKYVVVLVVRASFARLTTELNVGVEFEDQDGNRNNGSRLGGLPQTAGQVDGWFRFEWPLTTAPQVGCVVSSSAFLSSPDVVPAATSRTL